jgi:hypothetical protein
MYAAARTLPPVLVIVLSVILGSEARLIVLGTVAGAIQACDALVGFVTHDARRTIGPFVLAVLEGLAIYVINKRRARGDRPRPVDPS